MAESFEQQATRRAETSKTRQQLKTPENSELLKEYEKLLMDKYTNESLNLGFSDPFFSRGPRKCFFNGCEKVIVYGQFKKTKQTHYKMHFLTDPTILTQFVEFRREQEKKGVSLESLLTKTKKEREALELKFGPNDVTSSQNQIEDSSTTNRPKIRSTPKNAQATISGIRKKLANTYDDVEPTRDATVSGQTVQPTQTVETASFYEHQKYSRTMERAENGWAVSTMFAEFLKKSSALEESYAKRQDKLREEFLSAISNLEEEGTFKNAFKDAVTATSARSEFHKNIKKDLDFLADKHETWHKNQHKTLLDECKAQQLVFKTAHIKWDFTLGEYNHSKDKYEDAVKDITDIGEQEVNDAKTSLTTWARKVEVLAPNFMLQMQEPYNECQRLESIRINYFAKTIIELSHILALNPDVKKQMEDAAELINLDADLDRFSREKGILMPFYYPTVQTEGITVDEQPTQHPSISTQEPATNDHHHHLVNHLPPRPPSKQRSRPRAV